MNTGSRHLGRQAALQMLYQWEVGRIEPADAMALHREIEQEGPELPAAGRRFAEELVEGTIARLPEIDALIAAQPTHWRIERMAVVDRLILRMAVYELLGQPDTPPAVVIDEAIELARAFSEEDAAGFVNGVLDGVLRAIAPGRPAHT